MTNTPAGPRLLGPADVRQLAASLDLRPTKQRGQNFVIDPNTVRRIVRDSGITAADVVVEVGPGLGSLTLALLEVARRVIAVEVDPLLAGMLPATIAQYAPDQAAAFEVVLADAMRVQEIPGPPPTALVANLPYNVSVPVLLHFGAQDAHIPADHVQQIAAAFPLTELHVYPAGHGFACDARAAYHAPSAELAAERSALFLKDKLSC